MKKVIVIGSGIAGLACSATCAKKGMQVLLLSPAPSERSQSVMASGGINAVRPGGEPGDNVESHIEDTLRGGRYLGGKRAVTGLCQSAGQILRDLERIGTVFSVDAAGAPKRRAFGGQSHKRTFYCGASTGKQIVTALIMEARKYESRGLIERRLWCHFYKALLREGVCYGAMIFDEKKKQLETVTADALVIATGGQNSLFGKTTGSNMCDGYAAGRLFMQGVALKNLEFIQYHPTTIETAQKKMLISEAVRGEGGRLFYETNGRRVYFMEEKYGPRGNLMTRDVISREIFLAPGPVYLDISFLGKKAIDEKLPEVKEVCAKYRGIDICREPIPVVPSVHFFMGGIAVHNNHETDMKGLFAVGECASMYHGANRLGGNSLLAAIHSGRTAANAIADGAAERAVQEEDFSSELAGEQARLEKSMASKSPFPVMYIRDMLAETMQRSLGIIRDEAGISAGLEDVDYYLSVANRISYDGSVSAYHNFSLTGILTLAKAALLSAKARKESRGAHCRSDYPGEDESYACATIVSYDGGSYTVSFDKEHAYES